MLVLIYFLVPSHWQWNLSFKTGYLSLSLFMTPLTFEVAIILILKHAASLSLSGTSPRIAITQAESDFQNANVASKIEEHFTGSYEEYTVEHFVQFIVDTNLGLSCFTSTQTMAYSSLKAGWRIGVGNMCNERAIYHIVLWQALCWGSLGKGQLVLQKVPICSQFIHDSLCSHNCW